MTPWFLPFVFDLWLENRPATFVPWSLNSAILSEKSGVSFPGFPPFPRFPTVFDSSATSHHPRPRLNNKSDAVPNNGRRNKQRIEREQIYDTTQTTTKLSSIFTRTPLNRKLSLYEVNRAKPK
ncbi:MAG: hypothetical protein ACXWKH_02645 [Limisphaerales bacterium]